MMNTSEKPGREEAQTSTASRSTGLRARIKQRWRPLLAACHDLTMTALSLWLATFLRVGADSFHHFLPALVQLTPVLLLIALVVYPWQRLYQGIWRYASIPDFMRIVRAVTITTLAFLAITFILVRLEPMPRSVPIIQWFMLLILLASGRMFYRLVRDGHFSIPTDRALIPVLLVGAQDGAAMFIRSQVDRRNAVYRIVGIVSQSAMRVGQEIHGVPVMGTLSDLGTVIDGLKAKDEAPHRVILTKSRGEIDGVDVRTLVEEADSRGLPVSRMGRPEDLQAHRDKPPELQPIAVEDLLGRPQADLERDAILEMVRGRTILVTGGGGTIGGELVRQLIRLSPKTLHVVDFGEHNLFLIDQDLRRETASTDHHIHLLDVRRAERVRDLFERVQPDIIFHAAALKHVPLVEGDPSEGVLTNIIGTRNVADAARKVGALAMVQVSTDKAVRPTNVMGATKRVAERYCQALDLAGADDRGRTRYLTVRFGNVLGSSGSVVPLFQSQLAKGGPLTVTHPDMERFFMTVREAVELILQAAAHGIGRPDLSGKIFVLDMGEPVKIVDLARQMIHLAGLSGPDEVEIVYTGLRPGEKLFEEVLDPAETPVAADVDGLIVASPDPLALEILQRTIDLLGDAASRDDLEGVIRHLLTLVPGYEVDARMGGQSRTAQA